MHHLKISIGIFLVLAASRFIPHPPNFTSLLALSFYIPVLFGIKFLPFLLISFIITDFIIGFHPVILFTWGSVILIGLISKFFISNITSRILGALSGACLFFIITNFGVWSLGSYGYTLEGFITCYILAIPFFTQSIVSTLFFSLIIELVTKVLKNKSFINAILHDPNR
ncbi:hypothetical protein N9T29_02755 [Candidatus Pelagibacter sp.]|nr:hypothetical protein [Candidatus Pelagibacter sp.]